MMIFIATAHAVVISVGIPGLTNISTAGPAGWVKGLYNFALIMAGLLAFGAIVYGGFKYATSAGNPSSQSEGKSWIWSALLGILLLAAAYLILHTVNPALVNLKNPGLTNINSQ